MAWKWSEPGRNGKTKSGFATEDAARLDAVTSAGLHRVQDPHTLTQLWRSLARAGWKVEFYVT